MNQVELPEFPAPPFLRVKRGRLSEEDPIRLPADAKRLWMEAAQILGRDRLQPNIGRVQQFDKESYQSLFRSLMTVFSAWFRSDRDFALHVISKTAGSVSADEVADILVSSSPEFLIQLEAKLQLKGLPSDVSRGFVSYFETLGRSGPARAVDLAVVRSTSQDKALAGRSTTSGASFVERARRLERSGYVDKALDLIYDCVDQMLRAPQFEQLAARRT